MKLNGLVFVTGLALGFVETFIVASEPFFLVSSIFPHTEPLLGTLLTVLSVSSLVIDPVIVFLVMFFIGRNSDLPSDFMSIFVSVLCGAFVGTFGCLALLAGYSLVSGLFQILEPPLVGDLLLDGLGAFRMALVAFAGFALAYFIRAQHEVKVKASP